MNSRKQLKNSDNQGRGYGKGSGRTQINHLFVNKSKNDLFKYSPSLKKKNNKKINEHFIYIQNESYIEQIKKEEEEFKLFLNWIEEFTFFQI